MFTVRRDLPELIAFVGRGQKIALAVEVLTVRSTGWLKKYAEHLLGDIPFVDALIVLIGEINVAVGCGRGAFGEWRLCSGELGKFDDLRVGDNRWRKRECVLLREDNGDQ